MRGLVSALGVGLTTAMVSSAALAQDLIGEPTNGGMGLQPAAAPLKHHAHFFHDVILLPIITVISLFVLGLLLWCVVRYNRKANPVPAKFSHNTVIEVVWTLVPVLILMFIAIFSFQLLFQYHDAPKADVTVKATGYQWYWGYEYPDQEIGEITSTMMSEDDVAKNGLPHRLYRLKASEPMVVPVNKVVRVQVTAVDVIHAFALPAFGLKTDAVPGRLNETWFKADRVGTFYGQCSELCGVDHAFMPIEIKVVSQAEFDAWVAAKKAPPAPTPAAVTPAEGAAPAAATPAPAAPAPAAPAAN
ncbi:cytochrome c oxidase subunit II [Caulobacter sp. SLTY]|uniref:cytochrome c oxidase subunit II n=1 Tax=Caulobacter sp. SLTY TaxID=2683262 RepID=UPI001F0F85D3|nr:cytochrome c oxidase subunit II [Caulobacter sp. SLTY]